MKITIRNKLMVSFAALFLIFSGTLVYISSNIATDALTDATLATADKDIFVYTRELSWFHDSLGNDLLSLSKTPPIKGIIRARLNGGFDKEGSSTYEQWINRLETIFEGIMSANEFYLQFRYIDENGNELVRVNRDQDQIKRVMPQDLQNKKNRDYFLESMQLPKNEVYISRLELNREGIPPTIEVPYKPIIRHAVALFDDEGNRRGIIITNTLANDFLDALRNEYAKDQGDIFLLDKDGYYLLHPQQDKEFGDPLNLNTGENVKNDFVDIAPQILSGQPGEIVDDTNIISYAPRFFHEGQKNDFWVLLRVVPKKKILAPVSSLKNTLLIVSLILLGLLLVFTYFVSFFISKPIRELIKASERVKIGNLNYKIKVKSKDEIGQLEETFNDMRLGLKDRNDLLNSLLKVFKGKFGKVAIILARKNIQSLVKKNPRIIKIIPKEMAFTIEKEQKLKKKPRGK